MKDETKAKPKLANVRQINIRLRGKALAWLESQAINQERTVSSIVRNIIRAAYEAATREAA